MIVRVMNTPWRQSSRSTTILIVRLRQIPSRSKDLESLRSDVVVAIGGQLPVLEGADAPSVLAREALDQVRLDVTVACLVCGLMSWGAG